MERPPYVIYERIFEPSTYIEFVQVTPLTDTSGLITAKIKIISGFPGEYYIDFKIGGVYSRALHFKTDFPVATVEVTVPPKSLFDPQIGHRVGDALESTSVTVKDKDGRRLPSYTVIAALDFNNKNFSNFRMDFT